MDVVEALERISSELDVHRGRRGIKSVELQQLPNYAIAALGEGVAEVMNEAQDVALQTLERDLAEAVALVEKLKHQVAYLQHEERALREIVALNTHEVSTDAYTQTMNDISNLEFLPISGLTDNKEADQGIIFSQEETATRGMIDELDMLVQHGELGRAEELWANAKMMEEQRCLARARVQSDKWCREKKTMQNCIQDALAEYSELFEKAEAIRLQFEHEKETWRKVIYFYVQDKVAGLGKSIGGVGDNRGYSFEQDGVGTFQYEVVDEEEEPAKKKRKHQEEDECKDIALPVVSVRKLRKFNIPLSTVD